MGASLFSNMNVVIFAGGNQTRFGKTLQEQSKVLYPLRKGGTVLSHTLVQLNDCDVSGITVAVADKKMIGDYVHRVVSTFYVPIRVDMFQPIPFVDCLERYRDLAPVTFIFGDVFFPPPSLTEYFIHIRQSYLDFDACVGVSPVPVGDYGVEVLGSSVVRIARGATGKWFTCGVFTLFRNETFSFVDHLPEKFTDVFAFLVAKGAKVGYGSFPSGLVDLDTPEEMKKFVELGY